MAAIVTAEAKCSIEECCCSWSYSGYSQADADRHLEAALEEQGAVRAQLGATDADGAEIVSLFCRDCWAGMVRATRGAA